MSNIIIKSEKIAEIREALQVIQLNCQQIPGLPMSKGRLSMTENVIGQVARIDKLLPDVNFEGVK